MRKIPEDIYTQYKRFKVTESAASTFTEGTDIPTGASVARIQDQSIAMEIRSIICGLSAPQDLPATGLTEYVWFGISTRSGLSAIFYMDAEHAIYVNQRSIRAGVGTYLPLLGELNEWMPAYCVFDEPVLISHAKLYPYIKSTNSSATAVAYGAIMFTYVLLDQGLSIEALEAFR